jgi:hypothetical protein
MIRRHRHTGDLLGAAAWLGLLAVQGGCFSEPSSNSGTGDDLATTVAPGESSGDSTGAVTSDPTTESGPVEGETTLTPEGSSGDAPGDTSVGGSDDGSSSGVADSSGDSGGSTDGGSTGGDAPLGVEDLVPGDLVITEVMWNPSCGMDSCEWLEILNLTASDVNLLDLYVRDDDDNAANQGRVTDDVIVGPGELVVITRGAGSWPYEFDAASVYGPNPGLNNNRPDRVSIRNETEMLDETASFPFDADEGIAWSLSGNAQDAGSNDSSLNWCLATTVLPTDVTDEFGTPLVPNEAC